MWTKMVLDFCTHRSHGLVEDRLYEWNAPTTTCAGLRARLYVAHGLALTIFDRFDDVGLEDVVARANLRIIVKVIRVVIIGSLSDNQFRWWYPALEKEVENALTALLNGEITPQAFCDRVEAAAEKTRKDDSVTKHKL